uniref:Peptidase S1 domain-containing protein n=1 Tax=Parastrongyloides trichosuri TaxID=131310 RepID=A0A0N4ZRX0_PARTI
MWSEVRKEVADLNVNKNIRFVREGQYVINRKSEHLGNKKLNIKSRCLPGPKGLPGLAGEVGLNGEPGKDGTKGNDFDENDIYGTCERCPAGRPGYAGYKGKRGSRGETGVKGKQGLPGKSGDMGEQGLEGEIGLQGNQGKSGEPGIPGEDGIGRSKGPPGERGPSGNVGEVGERGTPGERGDIGLPGEEGIQGPPGETGQTGKEGLDGNIGPQGKYGIDGGYCFCPERNNKKFPKTKSFVIAKDIIENKEEVTVVSKIMKPLTRKYIITTTSKPPEVKEIIHNSASIKRNYFGKRVPTSAAEVKEALFFVFKCIAKDFNIRIISLVISKELTVLNEKEANEIHAICGKTEKNGRKFPWAVSILHKGKNKIGGTIISPYHILTVAHGFLSLSSFGEAPCTIERIRNIHQIRERVVSIGDDCNRGYLENDTNVYECQTSEAKYYKIKSVVFDNAFIEKGCRGGHDWAIIELDNPIKFNEKVKPICLPYPNTFINEYLTIVSWGKQEYFKKSSPLMRIFRMKHDKHCQKPITDTMPTNIEDYICAKALNTKDFLSPRVCLGDSGSGVQQVSPDGIVTLVGITSFGSVGCPPNELARLTRVDKYLNDICILTGLCYTL